MRRFVNCKNTYISSRLRFSLEGIIQYTLYFKFSDNSDLKKRIYLDTH